LLTGVAKRGTEGVPMTANPLARASPVACRHWRHLPVRVRFARSRPIAVRLQHGTWFAPEPALEGRHAGDNVRARDRL